jgi:hypothetical protein
MPGYSLTGRTQAEFDRGALACVVITPEIVRAAIARGMPPVSAVMEALELNEYAAKHGGLSPAWSTSFLTEACLEHSGFHRAAEVPRHPENRRLKPGSGGDEWGTDDQVEVKPLDATQTKPTAALSATRRAVRPSKAPVAASRDTKAAGAVLKELQAQAQATVAEYKTWPIGVRRFWFDHAWKDATWPLTCPPDITPNSAEEGFTQRIGDYPYTMSWGTAAAMWLSQQGCTGTAKQ